MSSASSGPTGCDGAAEQGYEISLTIPALDLDDDSAEVLEDVPVLVRMVPAIIDYDQAQDDGAGVRFYDGTEGVLIPHEVEQWNPVGVSIVWVRLPRINLAEETQFFLRYADPDPPQPLSTTQVWSNGYLGVWHFNDDEGFVSQYADATGNGFDFTVGDSSAQLIREDTELGLAYSTIDENNFPTAEFAPALNTGRTISARVRPTDVSIVPGGMRHRCVLTRFDAYRLCAVHRFQDAPFFGLSNTVTEMMMTEEIFGNGIGSSPLVAGEWVTLAGTYASNDVEFYLDGQLEDWETFVAGPRENFQGLQLGNRYSGLIDELRLASSPRSSLWLEVQHLSMTDNLIDYGPCTPLN